MSVLYILGNGFDLMHNIPSKYSNFKSFLEGKKEYSDLFENLNELFNETELWRDFENELAKPNQDLLSKLSNFFGTNVIGKCFKEQLQLAFDAWIRHINNFEIKKIFRFDKSDTFLSFNYTTTLEVGYGIELDRVKHIHNCVGDNYFDNSIHCIFGHDSIEYNSVNKEWIESTYKDTNAIIHTHSKWFKALAAKNINEIRVIGFSYNKVDDKYFEEINKVLRNRKWVLNVHGPKDLENSYIFFNRIGLDRNNIETSNYGGGNING